MLNPLADSFDGVSGDWIWIDELITSRNATRDGCVHQTCRSRDRTHHVLNGPHTRTSGSNSVVALTICGAQGIHIFLRRNECLPMTRHQST